MFVFVCVITILGEEVVITLYENVHTNIKYLYLSLKCETQTHIFEYDMINERGTFICKELNINIPLKKYDDNPYCIQGRFGKAYDNIEGLDGCYEDYIIEGFLKKFVVIKKDNSNDWGTTLATVIKSITNKQIEELKAENASLKATIAAFETRLNAFENK